MEGAGRYDLTRVDRSLAAGRGGITVAARDGQMVSDHPSSAAREPHLRRGTPFVVKLWPPPGRYTGRGWPPVLPAPAPVPGGCENGTS